MQRRDCYKTCTVRTLAHESSSPPLALLIRPLDQLKLARNDVVTISAPAMGCAQSTPAPEVEAPVPKQEAAASDVDLSNMDQGCSTVEMFEAVFRVAEPLIRNAVMKALVYHDLHPNLGVRKNEKPLERFDESDFHPFVVKPKALHLLTYEEFAATQSEWKNFKWPENLRALWESDGFVAADLIDLEVMLRFKPGIELYFGSSTASVELGSDRSSSTSDDASICIKAPRVRVWWSSKYKELSLAFVEARHRAAHTPTRANAHTRMHADAHTCTRAPAHTLAWHACIGASAPCTWCLNDRPARAAARSEPQAELQSRPLGYGRGHEGEHGWWAGGQPDRAHHVRLWAPCGLEAYARLRRQSLRLDAGDIPLDTRQRQALRRRPLWQAS